MPVSSVCHPAISSCTHLCHTRSGDLFAMLVGLPLPSHRVPADLSRHLGSHLTKMQKTNWWLWLLSSTPREILSGGSRHGQGQPGF